MDGRCLHPLVCIRAIVRTGTLTGDREIALIRSRMVALALTLGVPVTLAPTRSVMLAQLHRQPSIGQRQRLEQQIGMGQEHTKQAGVRGLKQWENDKRMTPRIISIGGRRTFSSEGSSVGGEDSSRRRATVPVRESTHRNFESTAIASICGSSHRVLLNYTPRFQIAPYRTEPSRFSRGWGGCVQSARAAFGLDRNFRTFSMVGDSSSVQPRQPSMWWSSSATIL